jgi:hypothetical protein
MPDESLQQSEFEREKWQAWHELELKKWNEDNSRQNRDLALKEQDQRLHERELNNQERELRKARWTNPLVLAILAAAIAGGANAGVSVINNIYQLRLENFKATQTYTLEQNKEEATRILEMIKVSGSEKTAPDQAATNLGFLVDLGLISDQKIANKIKEYVNNRKPGTPGPYLAVSRGVGQIAYSGDCVDHLRLVGYLDATGAATIFEKIPC